MSNSKNFKYLLELPLIVIAAILLPLLHVCYYGAVVYLLPGNKNIDVSLSKNITYNLPYTLDETFLLTPLLLRLLNFLNLQSQYQNRIYT